MTQNGKTTGAQIAARYRKQHPDRAHEQAKRGNAMAAARIKLAERHLDEFEELLDAELRKRGVSRWSAPLDESEDRRTVRGRLNR